MLPTNWSRSLLFLAATAAYAQDDKIAALESAVKSAQMAGDNAWMMTSAALVLMMTGPGLALFYCGLVRRKNVLGTMMQSFILMCVVTVLWALFGYSLAFGEGSPFLGDLRYMFLNGVGGDPNADYARDHPAADVHGVSVDVRDHYAGANLRGVCRTDAISAQWCSSVLSGYLSSICRWLTWCGVRADF